MVHAIPHHKCRARLLGTAQEDRYIVRPMLTIAIQGQHPGALPRERGGDTGLDRRAFARVSRPPDYLRSRFGRPGRRFIVRTIIHHHHQWDMLPNGPNKAGNAGLLVAARDHSGACRGPVHP